MRRQLPSVVLAMALLCWGFLEPAHAQRRGEPVQLPEGAGQELVQATCTRCHGLNTISNSGFTADGWEALNATMVELPSAEAKSVAGYLAEHFPERPERRPTLVRGDKSIEITEWIVPTLGQRVRDPIEAPDGSIWWTGMWASLAGRLDPQTGEMTEFPVSPTAKPHTIVPDADGNIWYTGNSNATIGKLDPRTGEITEYQTQARDPHTALFHPNGKFYFTAVGLEFVIRPPLEAGPCPGSGRSNAHGCIRHGPPCVRPRSLTACSLPTTHGSVPRGSRPGSRRASAPDHRHSRHNT